MRVLIVGGYGTFGGRLAQLLRDEPRLTLLIAGRSQAKAARFCAELGGAARLEAQSFDRAEPEARLLELAPDLVVDASGPFQAYGARPYRLIEAAIAAGIDYMDLADGSDFVHGVEAYDVAARAKGVTVLSGVSSFPVLTAAVVKRLAAGMTRVDRITGGIAPSPYAGVGPNVIRAIAGYAGKRMRIRRGGREACAHALTEARRMTIAPPGEVPLPSTLFSLVDVPDLQELPRLWPGVEEVWMGAGPVPEVLHRALMALSWLVRLGIVPSLGPLAPLFHRAINVLRWGEHRGGMLVRVAGLDGEGRPLERSWHLLAEGDHGPLIPSMAVEALVRKRLAGERPRPGARSAVTALELSDYEALLARRTIRSGIRERHPERQPLYRRLLGSAYAGLPEAIRIMHDLDQGTHVARGIATVERGASPLARLAAALFGFPRAGNDVPVTVTFEVGPLQETWNRNFAGTRFRSLQRAGTGRGEALLDERFGPFTFGLALLVREGRLELVARRWRCLGLPLPLALSPRGRAFEHAEDGRFHFDVEIGLPLVGRVVRYQGWLAAPERVL